MLKRILIICLLMSSQVYAGLLYNYNELILRDLDQMNKMIQDKIKESRKEDSDKTIPLKEAIQAVYCRPNEDGLIDKIIGPVQSELQQHDALEHTLEALTTEAINALKNPKAFKPSVQVTYYYFLRNIIAEMKPKIRQPFQNKLITRIRDAEIEISKEARNEQALQTMRAKGSPSDIAKAVLEDDKKKQEAEKEAAENKED